MIQKSFDGTVLIVKVISIHSAGMESGLTLSAWVQQRQEVQTFSMLSVSAPLAFSVLDWLEVRVEGEAIQEILSVSAAEPLGPDSGGPSILELVLPKSSSADLAHEWQRGQRHLQSWLKSFQCVELFFSQQGFLRLPTPTLQLSAGTEANVDPIYVPELDQYLTTSPEFSLKRALALGLFQVFDIRPCFRKEVPSESHLSEFFMVEWYRAYSQLEDLKADVKALLESLALHFHLPSPSVYEFQLKELFFDLAGAELNGCLKTSVFPEAYTRFESADDKFWAVFVDFVEPFLRTLPRPSLAFLQGFPGDQAAYAKLDPEGWAQRFEVYLNGIEIANAYQEIVSLEEQAGAFLREQSKKRSAGKVVPPLDTEALFALKMGMPPACGIALGLERTLQALCGPTKNIRNFTIWGSSGQA